jgi:dTDP-4-amino-4,6-dideoxygalactose transaminase
MKTISRYNYAAQYEGSLQPLMADIERMLLDGRYVLGEDVASFERAFASYLGVPHVLGLNSGTDALVVALMALGIGPGDEVITQANTFHATVAAICLVGAVPVLVDADAESFLIDTDQLEAAVTGATRGVIAVHLFGKPCPMDTILALARRHDLAVIEDAAQAHGARTGGRRVGSIGTIGCFSFHPSKNLAAAGDGGSIATWDAALAADIDSRRSLGQQRQNHHVTVGLNSKLDAIQARILEYKLHHLDQWNAGRQRVARGYRERLADLPVSFQREDEDEDHVYHLFQLRSSARDDLLTHLATSGIEATVRYPCPIHLQPAFAGRGWRLGDFPTAELLARELVCLPIRPDMDDAEIDRVAEVVRTFFEVRI